MITKTVEERFWSKVFKAGDDECWIWQGSVSNFGYGKITINGKSIRVTRLSYQLANSDNPLGPKDKVCHSCDNPSCVNPRHLWKGTHTDNMHDMFNKGRGKRIIKGKLVTQYIFTPNQIEQIRIIYASGEKNQTELARIYGCSQSTIGRIVHGKLWKDCTGPISSFVKLRNAKRPSSRKTHCIRGHEFSSENTYRTKLGKRQCRICTNMRYRRRYAFLKKERG